MPVVNQNVHLFFPPIFYFFILLYIYVIFMWNKENKKEPDQK